VPLGKPRMALAPSRPITLAPGTPLTSETGPKPDWAVPPNPRAALAARAADEDQWQTKKLHVSSEQLEATVNALDEDDEPIHIPGRSRRFGAVAVLLGSVVAFVGAISLTGVDRALGDESQPGNGLESVVAASTVTTPAPLPVAIESTGSPAETDEADQPHPIADPTPATVTLMGVPDDALVLLDDRRVVGPLQIPVDGRRHVVEVHARGFRSYQTRLSAESSGPVEHEVQLIPWTRRSPIARRQAPATAVSAALPPNPY